MWNDVVMRLEHERSLMREREERKGRGLRGVTEGEEEKISGKRAIPCNCFAIYMSACLTL